MNDYILALILGIVEGLTEFLPVSSTGHLIIAQNLLKQNGPRFDSFNIVVQLGAILAVVVLYWPRFWGLLFPPKNARFAGVRGIGLLFLTTVPAGLVGLFAGSFIKSVLFNPISVSLSLAVGAVIMLLVERRNAKRPEHTYKYEDLDSITPQYALIIGLFQCLPILWPGFSRSAATIMGGMLFGANRKLAADYSFIAAVPIMFAATGYELLQSYDVLSRSDLSFFGVGILVAFISALVAVKAFIGLVNKLSLRPFAWYRLAIAPVVYIFFSMQT